MPTNKWTRSREARAPGKSALQARTESELLATMGPLTPAGRLAVAALGAAVVWGVFAFLRQAIYGLGVTAMTDYFSWGVYIVNFVFFIGISHAGTLISAILRVTGTEWRRPITRMAEGITLFALLVGAPMVIIDMGRPDRVWHVLVYGRAQSPILWDVLSITTYLTGSLLYLYLPMIPDLALLRDQGARFGRFRRWLYGTLALGWTGTAEQHRRLEKAISTMAIVIIPVAISVHTVVSWIFGMTLRPGWHSTIFGPYFVVGAIFSGIAAIITAMAMFRRFFHLGAYITVDHFRKLGALLLTLNLVYIYFTASEYITLAYTKETADRHLLARLFEGQYATEFWVMAVLGLLVPALLLSLPRTRSIGGIVTASLLVNIGMWIKRYVIVVPTLATPFLPPGATGGQLPSYVPTWVEWSITGGALAAFCLLYILFSKLFPIVSIWEVVEGQEAATATDVELRVPTAQEVFP